jgi:hypothetical protein
MTDKCPKCGALAVHYRAGKNEEGKQGTVHTCGGEDKHEWWGPKEYPRSNPPNTTSLAYLPCCDLWEDTENDTVCGTCDTPLDAPGCLDGEDPLIAIYPFGLLLHPDGKKEHSPTTITEEGWHLNRVVMYEPKCKRCSISLGIIDIYTIKGAIDAAKRSGWKDGLCLTCQPKLCPGCKETVVQNVEGCCPKCDYDLWELADKS